MGQRLLASSGPQQQQRSEGERHASGHEVAHAAGRLVGGKTSVRGGLCSRRSATAGRRRGSVRSRIVGEGGTGTRRREAARRGRFCHTGGVRSGSAAEKDKEESDGGRRRSDEVAFGTVRPSCG